MNFYFFIKKKNCFRNKRKTYIFISEKNVNIWQGAHKPIFEELANKWRWQVNSESAVFLAGEFGKSKYGFWWNGKKEAGHVENFGFLYVAPMGFIVQMVFCEAFFFK